jgi:hypothetical protein
LARPTGSFWADEVLPLRIPSDEHADGYLPMRVMRIFVCDEGYVDADDRVFWMLRAETDIIVVGLGTQGGG